MSMTTKGDGAYEAPWFVLPDNREELSYNREGASSKTLAELQRDYLIEAFKLDPANVEGLSLVDTFMHCAFIWRERAGLTNSGFQIVAGVELPASAPAPAAKPRSGGRRATAAKAEETKAEEPAAPAHEFQAVLDQIAKAESAEDIRGIFLDNKDAFNNADVADAASAKRKTFS